MGAVVLVAFGGFVLMEGLMWAIAPTAMRRAYEQMIQQVTDRDLHIAGAFSVFIGTCMLAYGAKLILQ